jgi:hypothetical protein
LSARLLGEIGMDDLDELLGGSGLALSVHSRNRGLGRQYTHTGYILCI